MSSVGKKYSFKYDETKSKEEKNKKNGSIGFIDDISILAETPKGMQTLLDVVQEFSTWCGMEINVKKTFLLVEQGSKANGKHSGTRSEDKWRTS